MSLPIPKPVSELRDRIANTYRDIKVTVDAPAIPSGPWYIDVKKDNNLLVINWMEGMDSFGLTTKLEGDDPMEGLFEYDSAEYHSIETAFDRCMTLITCKERAMSPSQRMKGIRARLANRETPGHWKANQEKIPLNDLGKAQVPKSPPETETTINTAYDHGQLGGPAPVVCLAVSPYFQRNHFVHISPNDAEFIGNAPADIEFLLAEIERLEKKGT